MATLSGSTLTLDNGERYRLFKIERPRARKRWTREQTIVLAAERASAGRGRNTKFVNAVARMIHRSSGSTSMKMGNLDSLDPRSGKKGLGQTSKLDEQVMNLLQRDNDAFLNEYKRAIRSLQEKK